MAEQDVPYRAGRRTVVRVLVPVGVIAIAAAGAGLIPALASDSGPSLPSLTAEQLVAKALGSDTRALSGTVQVTADLGVPAQLLGVAGGAGAGALGGRTPGGGGPGGTAAAPQSKLTELLAGEHTLQVAVDGPGRQRIGLIDHLAGYELVHNGDQLWAWDSATNQAVHLTAPQSAGKQGQQHAGGPLDGVPTTPQEAAKKFLTLSGATTSVTVAGTAQVAGQNAYELSVKPTQSGSTIGEVRIAVDADNGVPLAVVVKETGGSTVLDMHFSSVSFATPDAKTFQFTAPKGAKVTESTQGGRGVHSGQAAEAPKTTADAGGTNVVGQGWTAVFSTRLPTSAAPAAGELTAGTRKHGMGGGAGAGMLQNPQALAKALGKPVAGGSLISTKVLNLLITDDGRVFAGAVTLPVLQSAAGVK